MTTIKCGLRPPVQLGKTIAHLAAMRWRTQAATWPVFLFCAKIVLSSRIIVLKRKKLWLNLPCLDP